MLCPLYDLISWCTSDCRSLCKWIFFCWNFCSLIGFFLFSLFSVTAAKVVEVSRRDSSTLSRLAYFDKMYLTLHGLFFFAFRSRFYLFKATSSHIFNRKSTLKSTSSRFWSKSGRFHRVKSLPGLAGNNFYLLLKYWRKRFGLLGLISNHWAVSEFHISLYNYIILSYWHLLVCYIRLYWCSR